MYLPHALLAIVAVRAERGMNNLGVSSGPDSSDSPRLHHSIHLIGRAEASDSLSGLPLKGVDVLRANVAQSQR
jgi:hypothetical protein